jgi:two-component system, sensor histidine kinase RegB
MFTHFKPILQPTSDHLLSATRQNMQRLMMLRAVVMLCLGLVIFGLRLADIPLHVVPLSAGIILLGLLSVIAWWRLRATTHMSQRELLLQLLGDIAAFSLIFYFSGGYSNPFIWMFLLPITVAAVALRAAYAWLVAALSVTSYTLLMFYHIPLSHLHMHMHGDTQLDIHLVGMWIGFVVSAVIVAIFIARIGQNLRDYDQKQAQVREKALESERMLALGTLATSAAHELGTPLATMAVVSRELTQDYANQPELLAQLAILQKQVSRCKEILSSITRNAGQSRADAGQGLPLREFVEDAIQRWRDTRPATELVVQLPTTTINPLILMDRTLTQALQNLLDNAADESPERILLNADWDEKLLKIQIRDFGKGLSTETKKLLGTPFFTSKNAQGVGSGMGLGVYLTQTTLARYDGELNLSNHAKGGVLTTVKLPLTKLRISLSKATQ